MKHLPFYLSHSYYPNLAIFLILVVMGGFTSLMAQDNPDAMFLKARELAFQQQYVEAHHLCDQILAINPAYHDASILKARMFAWEEQYDSARALLEKVLLQAPRNREAIAAMADLEIWSGNHKRAIRYLDLMLAEQPSNTDWLFKKALALKESGDETAAVVLLNQILSIHPSHKEAKVLLESIQSGRQRNHIGVGYRGYWFLDSEIANNRPDPWHLLYAEYGRRASLLGPVIFRTNLAERYGLREWQVEIDAYPSIRPGTYLYLNAGYAHESSLFPETRFGFEFFQRLPMAFELSAGFRLLNFGTKDLLILTGSASKYFNRYYISFRPYFTKSSVANDPTAQSYYLTLRRYFSSTDHHLTLIGGRGFSSDAGAMFGGEFYDLGGTQGEFMLTYQHPLSTQFLIRIGAGYKFYEENLIYGNPSVFEGGLIWRF